MYPVTTDEKKIVEKPKLMDTYSEQSELLSDNDSEFSDTPSKGNEEEGSGSSYRSKGSLNKSMCSSIPHIKIFTS